MDKSKLIFTVGKIPLVSNALRWYANCFPEGSVVTIKNGYAAGYKWKRYHRHVSGYWVGHYELAMQKAISRELSHGDIFFDVGANAGFFTLVAASIVGRDGHCVAFEPLPENVDSIREQIDLNSLSNCHVVDKALSDHEGVSHFYCGKDTSTAHLGETHDGTQTIQVELTTLDNALTNWGAPALIKMDIEGGEIDALKGASTLLQDGCAKFLIELHGEKCGEEVRAILQKAGYSFYDLEGTLLDFNKNLPRHIIAKKALK